jgi:hypothetical protein
MMLVDYMVNIGTDIVTMGLDLKLHPTTPKSPFVQSQPIQWPIDLHPVLEPVVTSISPSQGLTHPIIRLR